MLTFYQNQMISANSSDFFCFFNLWLHVGPLLRCGKQFIIIWIDRPVLWEAFVQSFLLCEILFAIIFVNIGDKTITINADNYMAHRINI